MLLSFKIVLLREYKIKTKMRKTLILISAITLVIQLASNAVAEDRLDLSSNKDFQAGESAAKCAGLYEFLTLLYQVKRDQARINVATTEMEAWKKTTKAAFTAAGLSRVKTTVKTDELIEKERQRYLYFMESTPKHLYPEIEAGLETCETNNNNKNLYKN